MRLFAIGDVHGCADALRRLDQELAFGAADTVVTLGDYVDRGPDTRAVIDHLLELRTRCRLVTLRGNHEVMMLRARDDCAFFPKWLTYGGAEALASYGATSLAGIPSAHWDFIESTVSYHEEEQDFFVHANVLPDLPLVEQPEKTLFWAHFSVSQQHVSGRRMICGHSAQKDGMPLDCGHAVCIDTIRLWWRLAYLPRRGNEQLLAGFTTGRLAERHTLRATACIKNTRLTPHAHAAMLSEWHPAGLENGCPAPSAAPCSSAPRHGARCE